MLATDGVEFGTLTGALERSALVIVARGGALLVIVAVGFWVVGYGVAMAESRDKAACNVVDAVEVIARWDGHTTLQQRHGESTPKQDLARKPAGRTYNIEVLAFSTCITTMPQPRG